jgi:methylmalonyl-CoA mutase C-terminal domain/subunit
VDRRGAAAAGGPAGRPIRVLLAKPGLDGHDKGVRVLTLALRDAGMDVVYTGLHQTPEEVAAAALQEDADVVGLSMLSGAHLALTAAVRERLEAAGLRDVVFVVGGVIPQRDVAQLRALGVDAVFPLGSRTDDIAARLRELVAARRAGARA